jgi:transient receptor potential cation channel subfamily V protein 6
VEDGLVSLAVPGTFLFFLFFGRIYALTGAFIVMIFEMITGDIATFGVIYVIVVTAFGQGRKYEKKRLIELLFCCV